MATGALGTLGVSSGVLTQDVIDQLKAADEKAQVQPYTTKIESNSEKQKALTELITKLTAFQTHVSDLGDSTAFSKRSVTPSVTGDSAAASLSASSGVNTQSLSVEVSQIAQKDVYQSGGISSDTDRVLKSGQSAGSFTLVQNGKTYTIKVDANTTYADLADKINSATDGAIQAKIVKTGESGAPYRLTLSSKETGTDNAISLVDGDGTKDASGNYNSDTNSAAILSNLGWSLDKTTANGDVGYKLSDPNGEFHIKVAQNAEFTLDGVKMVRQSNEVTDIGAGLTLTLKKAGEINFDVKQDLESVKTTMEDLSTTYNELITALQDYTKYDSETGTAGVFQGTNEITSIRSSIFSVLSQTQSVEGTEKDDNGNTKKVNVLLSLQDFGLTINESGMMSFNSTTFDEKIAKDVSLAEQFFSGTSGFEDINVVGKSVKLDQDITFTNNSFKITFNETTYDLSKTKDGQDFVLTGTTAQERAQNLLDHINSFGIEDLKVTMQEVNMGASGTNYVLKFNSDNGSDFELSGDSKILEQMGLESTKVIPQIQQGTGVFAELKSVLKGMTDTGTGSLSAYSTSLTNESKQLTESKTKAQTTLDTKYDTMTQKFIQYEQIIAKLQTQSSTITNMINAMSNSNS